MDRRPLFAHREPEAVIAYVRGRPVSAAQFVCDARALAVQLPAAKHVLNACSDRYRFTVGLAASLMRGQVSVLPSTQTPEVIRHLSTFAPDVYCLTDEVDCPLKLPLHSCRALPSDEPASIAPGPAHWEVPQIDAQQLAAYVFTSGSTGIPVPHAKSWGRLVRCVRAEAARLPPVGERACALLATVPPQHMYGFESSVLLPLQSGGALSAERPFFPADIAAGLAALPRPRVLLTTPVHLRALLNAETELPAADLVVSATAMLSPALARAAERRFGAPLLEIYGSTESGQIASRRSTQEEQWWLWPDVRLVLKDGRGWVDGGHVAEPTLLADILEPISDERFLLHGRTADLVNIAGKRSSLAYLNHQLNAIPGVLDGAFFVREDTMAAATAVARLAALVVAPQLSAAAILSALRERIDPVFLPRPLLLVERLPRNATGKLPLQTLASLAAQIAEREPQLFA